MKNLPLQLISEEIILDKYAKNQERSLSGSQATPKIRKRVAKGLSRCEENQKHWEKTFYDAQVNDGVIMAGRVNSAAGTDIDATLINCFVQPVADTASGYVGKRTGIYLALQQAAETMRRGGGEGFNFSYIRPDGAKVKGTGSKASGPISFMQVFNSSCVTVESAGARRGAMMGILNVNHPNIRQFIAIKETKGTLDQFNLSVGVYREFMEALLNDRDYQLVHEAEPNDQLIEEGAFQREDGLWVYETVRAQEIWDLIMAHTYGHADPGVVFLDRVNEENNLWYCEIIDACNPCGEQYLPDYGCCCLAAMNLTAFVTYPMVVGSVADDCFDWERFKRGIRTAVRMLDNVLTVTYWPLEEQKKEAESKRRIGLGFTGLGSMLALLGLRYDSQAGREFASKVSEVLRDEAYRASIELAKEKGAFPLFDKEKYLKSKFIKRLPKDIQEGIASFGIRNSHLLSIAPTGTISIAFADNASGGLEPAFSWTYTRHVRAANDSKNSYEVMDHAYRLYKESGGDLDCLPDSFVSAMEISPEDHLLMVAAVAPMIDSAISKTINVPEDYPIEKFQDIYLKAYELGLKGVTTYRPNSITGAVLEATPSIPADLDTSADRKIKLDKVPEPALNSLRWPKRPKCPDGNDSKTYLVDHPESPFAVFIGDIVNGSNKPEPFEVWVTGEEQPRCVAALAKVLSTDLRSYDRGWLNVKLDSLSKTGGVPFAMTLPGHVDPTIVPSDVAALALLIKHRCNELGVLGDVADTPLLDALISQKEPKSGTDGTLSWTVDINNPSTGDDFVMFVKELVMPDGTHRPYSLWFSGNYPKSMDGLAKALSLDLRVLDPGWAAKKLRSISNLPEPQGDFLAKVPGEQKQASQPSTVAYVARLILHRFHMLGLLDRNGYPVNEMGIFKKDEQVKSNNAGLRLMVGKKCPACGVNAVIKKDGCDFCTACGEVGSCG